MHLLILLGLVTNQIERIAYPFIYLKPEEGTPFGRRLPAPCIGYYREYPSPHRGATENLWLLQRGQLFSHLDDR